MPIVGVAYKDQDPNTQAYLRTYGDPYGAVLTDPSGRTGVDWGISGVPETFAIDAKGQIIAKISEPLTPRTAQTLVESLSR